MQIDHVLVSKKKEETIRKTAHTGIATTLVGLLRTTKESSVKATFFLFL